MRMVLDTLGQTLRTLWAHKLRSFLTMFGIAWGVGSLLLLVGLGEGFRSGNRRQLETMGQDIIFIFPGRVPAVAGQHQGMKQYFLTYQRSEERRVGKECRSRGAPSHSQKNTRRRKKK